ncbi:nuclear transport factor 2 family protein [Craterilacuibacter sp. RT1T]|uniref:nuclear transport factor 2 family protein n=1 Tax=Craterilacuibacter sp. RT1T TaxID=2942211 RepID=UPI0020C12747|nr:nuclear transport factor 2 family protein [Craterilacuibacter sp. RT1T]MCL6262980.1 nuclear transport factor 2 family protein [Craterilacuibacter sp. RT1T]
MPRETLEERLDRLESIEEIRQLAGKYSLSLDMRDLDAHVNLFAPDIRVGREKTGRAHLKAWVDDTLRHQFTGTSHHVGQHIIEFTDPDHAIGVVYSKNEHECGREWVTMQMLYWDDYERVNGRWLFRRRLPCYWYASDLNQPPVGDMKMRWPGRAPYSGTFHDIFPSWQSFWAERPDKDSLPEVAAPAPLEGFLKAMRRDVAAPKIRVR